MTEECGVAAETLFLIPAFNAARTLGPVLDGVLQEIERHGLEERTCVLVVDDGSTDETAEVALARGVEIERHSHNRGKGAALRLGLGWAQAHKIPKVVSLDADGQHPPSEAIKLCLHSANAETLLIGTRDLKAAQAPRPNQLSNAFSNYVLSLFAHRQLEDTQSGLRRYPASLTLALNSKAEGFAFEADVLLRAARAGLPIVHVPTKVLYPPSRTSHFRAVADPARIVGSVVRTTLTTPRKKPATSHGVLFSGAPLLIFLNGQGQAPELNQALLDACSEAATPRICEAAPGPALAAVEVSWHDELSSASVKFLDQSTGRAAETRTISFVSEDPEPERFRAVGYAIGTWGTSGHSESSTELAPGPAHESPSPGPSTAAEAALSPAVASQLSGPEATGDEPPEPKKMASEDPERSRPAPSHNHTPIRWFVDAGVDLGTSYSNEPRVGPAVGLGGQHLLGPLDLALRGAFHYVPDWTSAGTTFSGHFWSIGLSVGLTGRQGPWSLSGELGPFLEETTLGGPNLTQNSRLQFGGKGALLVRRELVPHLAALAGLEVGLRSGATSVQVDGQTALTLSPLFATLRLGICVHWGEPTKIATLD